MAKANVDSHSTKRVYVSLRLSVNFCSLVYTIYVICNVQLKNLRIEQNTVWSKTTLITRGVGVAGPGVDPPTCKMDTFFLRSLALSVLIYRNFQSNGANWRIDWNICCGTFSK